MNENAPREQCEFVISCLKIDWVHVVVGFVVTYCQLPNYLSLYSILPCFDHSVCDFNAIWCNFRLVCTCAYSTSCSQFLHACICAILRIDAWIRDFAALCVHWATKMRWGSWKRLQVFLIELLFRLWCLILTNANNNHKMMENAPNSQVLAIPDRLGTSGFVCIVQSKVKHWKPSLQLPPDINF